MDVGVRELKKHLSEYLERAARGEVIRVTDRGRAKALLGPPLQHNNLTQGVADGWIRARQGVPARSVRRVKAHRATADVVAEDRE